MKAEDIKKILIAGAGTMGQSIGLSCLTHGFTVVMYDIKEELLAKARERMTGKIDRLAENGAISKEKAEVYKNNIRTTTDIAEAGFLFTVIPAQAGIMKTGTWLKRPSTTKQGKIPDQVRDDEPFSLRVGTSHFVLQPPVSPSPSRPLLCLPEHYFPRQYMIIYKSGIDKPR